MKEKRVDKVRITAEEYIKQKEDDKWRDNLKVALDNWIKHCMPSEKI